MSDTSHFDTGFLFSASPVQISPHFCTKFPFLPNIVQILLFFCTKLSFCYNIVQIMAHFYTIISSATPSCNSKGPQNGLRYGWQSIPDVPNFLTRKCPSASQKRHFLKQTEILRPIRNDCLRHLRIFCGPFCCIKVLHYIWKHAPARMADKAISEVEKFIVLWRHLFDDVRHSENG